MCYLAVLFASILVIGSSQGQNVSSRVVNTTQGPVRGYEDESGGLFVFYSIPYATAPTGPNRFKAPLPAPTWSETFEAIDFGIVCPQNHEYFPIVLEKTMREDCLIANVYAPASNESNIPVLVYVHGGGFQLGYGDMVTPRNIVRTQRVIVVTFNYRLGPHGFLCLGTEDAPGNAGLKDQVALLRWVNANIRNFGGNPDDVTIGGCSAGAVSVDLLRLSRSTDGLFNKVIPESASNVGAIIMQVDPVQNARTYAQRLNINLDDDVFAIETFYKNASYEQLFSIPVLYETNDVIFAPCIERYVGEEVILDENPRDIIRNSTHRKYPILYGFTDMEGLFRLPQFYEWQEIMNENFEVFLPRDLQFENEEQKQEVISEIKQFYFGNHSVNNDTVLGYINFNSDTMFIYGILDSVRLHLENGNDTIYLYEYSFVDENTPVIPHTDGMRGADHCAQCFAVFDQDENISQDYENLKIVIREMWLNFITTGEPVPAGSGLPAWPTTGANSSPYMSIGRTIELRHQEALPNVSSFWRDIYRRHYRAPTPPPAPTPSAPDSAFVHRINTYLCIICILIYFSW